jgi:hypothetical protein
MELWKLVTDLTLSPFFQFIMWLQDKFKHKETEEEKRENEAFTQEIIKGLKAKGFEVSINKTTKTYRNKNWNASQGPYKDLTKTVFNVWTRDTMSWHLNYKKNGQRRF